MIGIVGAMEVEIAGLKNAMDIKETVKIASTDFFVGNLGGTDIVVAKCSPGKVNAALCTQAMIMQFKPSLIINPGVAGGIAENIKIGDLVVATECVQHDYDTTALGDKLGTVFTNKGDYISMPTDTEYSNKIYDIAKDIYSNNIHKGIIATGDTFVADKDKCNQIHGEFNAVACEMECASICQVCFLNDTPFVCTRSISDNANDSETVDFMTFVNETAELTVKLMTDILPKL